MAGYSIVSDISQYLVDLLREHLFPDFIQSTEAISLATPADKNGDYLMGVFLYDLQTSEFSMPQMFQRGDGKKQYPPKALKLRYVIFLNSKAQVASKEDVVHSILGKAMQSLYDHALVPINRIHNRAEEMDGDATLSLLNIGLEEKMKIWTALSLPFQVALYVEVSPVLLSSTKQVETNKVIETEFVVRQKKKGDKYD